MGNKYLFLDIDGVLNHDEWFGSPEYKNCKDNWKVSMFDPKCVDRVNKILQETRAELVVSSSWRDMADLEEIFEGVGLPFKFWRTPYADQIYPELNAIRDMWEDEEDIRYWRGSEIKYFLERHPCDAYVILDDDTDMLPEQMHHFVNTCGDRIYHKELYLKNQGSGLTEKCMNKAIDILNGRIKKTD